MASSGIERIFRTRRFESLDDQDRETRDWQTRYFRLREHLGRMGTEVTTRRIVEEDQDIRPGRFFRDARHEFVFPSQTVANPSDATAIRFDGTPGYSLVYEEDVVLDFDPDKVIGHLVLCYDDSGSQIDFKLLDAMRPSQLPDGLEEIIDEILAGTEAFVPETAEF